MKLTTGYKKPIASSGTDALELSSNNSYLLLAGGGHKALSELVSPADLTTELSNYVTIGSNQTITGIKTFSLAINADISGNADTVDGEHAVAFAHIGAHNNLTVNNEFTFASNGFSGDIWFNYRTAGGTNGNITDYIFGNGKGGQLYSLKTIATNASTAYSWGNHANVGYLLRSDIGSLSVNYATNAGNAGTLNGHTADDFVLKTTHDVYESVIVESLNDLDNRKIEISDLPTSLPANGGHAATATNVDWSGITNKPSSFPANGGNADTINGYSSSDFVLNTNYGEFKSVVATALTDLDTRKVDVSDLVDYEVIITEQGASDNTLKSYVITLGGSNIGTISIPKDLILSSGSVVVGNWVNGIFTEDSSGTGKAIKLVISNQSDPIYINVQDLSDVYTVQQGATEVQLAISSTNEISAALVKNVRDKIDNAIPKVSGATGKVAQFKADGSLESSSYEIKQSVPSDAVFTDTTYSIATSDTLGLVKIGYVANDKNYPVQLSDGQMYVTVPWTDNYRDITDSYLGTSSDISLSQKGGNDIFNALVNGYASSAGDADKVDGKHANDFIQKITVGEVTTGEPGTYVSVKASDTRPEVVFDFSIPRGANGKDGKDGVSPTIEIGKVTTVPSTLNASVVNSSDTNDLVILDFSIPRGANGNMYETDDYGTDSCYVERQWQILPIPNTNYNFVDIIQVPIPSKEAIEKLEACIKQEYGKALNVGENPNYGTHEWKNLHWLLRCSKENCIVYTTKYATPDAHFPSDDNGGTSTPPPTTIEISVSYTKGLRYVQVSIENMYGRAYYKLK